MILYLVFIDLVFLLRKGHYLTFTFFIFDYCCRVYALRERFLCV
jgi:hypothetical protein